MGDIINDLIKGFQLLGSGEFGELKEGIYRKMGWLEGHSMRIPGVEPSETVYDSNGEILYALYDVDDFHVSGGRQDPEVDTPNFARVPKPVDVAMASSPGAYKRKMDDINSLFDKGSVWVPPEERFPNNEYEWLITDDQGYTSLSPDSTKGAIEAFREIWTADDESEFRAKLANDEIYSWEGNDWQYGNYLMEKEDPETGEKGLFFFRGRVDSYADDQTNKEGVERVIADKNVKRIFYMDEGHNWELFSGGKKIPFELTGSVHLTKKEPNDIEDKIIDDMNNNFDLFKYDK